MQGRTWGMNCMVSRKSDRFRCAAGGAGRPLSPSVNWPNQLRLLLTPLPRFACTHSPIVIHGLLLP